MQLLIGRVIVSIAILRNAQRYVVTDGATSHGRLVLTVMKHAAPPKRSGGGGIGVLGRKRNVLPVA